MSLKKIAEMTGLSVSTVSHAINGTRSVSEENKKVVLEAAKKINYRPNLAARALRTQKSNTIAIIIPAGKNNVNANYFYMDAVMGARSCVDETEYDFLISGYDPKNVAAGIKSLNLLKKQWIDGIIFVPSSSMSDMAGEEVSALRELGVPFVLLDRKANPSQYTSVSSDNFTGAKQAAELLIRSGWKNIGFIGGNLNTSTSMDRFSGFHSTFVSSGHPFSEQLVVMYSTFSSEKGAAGAKQLLEKGADAIFAADNDLLLGAVRYLSEQGIRIGTDFGIVGFDDFSWMDVSDPPITTVKQDTYGMGREAALLLLKKIRERNAHRSEDAAEENFSCESTVLPVSLIVRKSHGKAE